MRLTASSTVLASSVVSEPVATALQTNARSVASGDRLRKHRSRHSSTAVLIRDVESDSDHFRKRIAMPFPRPIPAIPQAGQVWSGSLTNSRPCRRGSTSPSQGHTIITTGPNRLLPHSIADFQRLACGQDDLVFRVWRRPGFCPRNRRIDWSMSSASLCSDNIPSLCHRLPPPL